jgi:hypothetical protein
MRRLFLFLCIALFAWGCKECSSREVTCPAYEEKGFSSWFPYISGQKIYFMSGASRDSLTIAPVGISQSYKERLSASSPWCTAYKYIMSAEKYSGSMPKLRFRIHQQKDSYGSGNLIEQVDIFMNGTTFEGTGIADTGLIPSSIMQPSQFYPSLSFGSASYLNVQVIVSDTNSFKSVRPYKIWISKNNGIISYEEYPSLKRWIKQ